MNVIKEGHHRLFENDPETSRIVSEMLLDLESHGLDAVRRYSEKFDNWKPERFELNEQEIKNAVGELEPEVIEDTKFCQANVRAFAQAQMETLLPLEIETRSGVVLGHKHIPVSRVGSYIPGGRYPMFGSAQMSIIPAKVAGVKNVIACTPPVQGSYFPATINAIHEAGADRIFIIGGVPAMALMAFGMGIVEPVDVLCGAETSLWQKPSVNSSGGAALTCLPAPRKSW